MRAERAVGWVLLLGAVLVTAAGSVSARTWHVLNDGTGDAPTIQAGVDSAAVGDTVLVHPGTYFETVVFRGRDIVLKSKDGPETTIIDGSQEEFPRVVSIVERESRSAVLNGLTITGGLIGVLVRGAQPTISGNVIKNNTGNFSGAGVACGFDYGTLNWSPLIIENDIVDNASGFSGGGIFVAEVYPHIINNRILRNRAEGGDGGGINWGRGNPVGGKIIGNVIMDNYAADHGGGLVVGFFNVPGMQIEIAYNIIARNRADGFELTGDSGGGMILLCNKGWVHHNTIVDNFGGGGVNYGGGISIANETGSEETSPLIEQNIIAFSSEGGGIQCTRGATPIIRDNLAWDNVGGHGVGECPDWWQFNDNIVADPGFCDLLGGDYSVASNSPAMTHPMGPLGAITPPGCGPTPVEPTTWGRIKAAYR